MRRSKWLVGVGAATAAAVIVACTALGAANGPVGSGRAEPGRVRIGVYDSRAVAIAWGRSEKTLAEVNAKVKEGQEARTAGNQKRFDEISQEMKRRQFTMHAQGFALYPPTEALEVLKPDLPGIAKDAGVVAIVDRLDYASAGVEKVDVTDKLVGKFGPTEQTKRILQEIPKHQPASLWDATHGED